MGLLFGIDGARWGAIGWVRFGLGHSWIRARWGELRGARFGMGCGGEEMPQGAGKTDAAKTPRHATPRAECEAEVEEAKVEPFEVVTVQVETAGIFLRRLAACDTAAPSPAD